MPGMNLKPCPFCGAELKDKPPFVDCHRTEENKPLWHVTHYCAHEGDDLGVCVTVYGDTKRQAVERWNTRVGDGSVVQP